MIHLGVVTDPAFTKAGLELLSEALSIGELRRMYSTPFLQV